MTTSKSHPAFLFWMSLVSSLFLGSAWVSQPLIAAEGSAKAITGTVKITPSLEKKIAKEAALYIIARPDGVQGGPPAAVKRFAAPLKFPVKFTLSSEDAMIPNGDFSGQFTITARIAQKGSASPANPGDLQTKAPVTGARPGGKPITLELNEIRK